VKASIAALFQKFVPATSMHHLASKKMHAPSSYGNGGRKEISPLLTKLEFEAYFVGITEEGGGPE
jgi:hypothetical protein